MPEIKPATLESLIGMAVHDLRSPGATLGANLSFVGEVYDDPSVAREEIRDALSDAEQALQDLMRGLDQLAWIGRWCNEKAAASSTVEPLRATFDRVRARVKHGVLEIEPVAPELRVRGGEALERLLDVLIANGHQHAAGKPVQLRASRVGEQVVIEVEDRGRPLAPELAPLAFSLEGQAAVKGRAEGRYGRVAGLFAASLLAGVLNARLEPSAREGSNVFRVLLAPA